MGKEPDRARAGRAISEDEEAVEQVGVEIEQSGASSLPVVDPPLDDSGFLEFVVSGTEAAGEFRCAGCGYGAVVQRLLPPCPMCAGTVWEIRGSIGPRPAG